MIKRTFALWLTALMVSAVLLFVPPGVRAATRETMATRWDCRALGWNTYGQLGDGTNNDSKTPVGVPGLTGVVSVAAGYGHSLALMSDGTVRTWGWNLYGQLGNGTNTDKNKPVRVSGLTGVVAVKAGYGHSLALMNDGTVRAWGWNSSGQLGDGTNNDRVKPVTVSGLSGVVAVSAGWSHSFAKKNDGTLRAWGWNYFGQLDDGTYTDRNKPVKSTNLGVVVAVVGGFGHTLVAYYAPTITGLSPDHMSAGSSGFTLTVNGRGFVRNSVVRWNGADRATTYVSGTKLKAFIPSDDIASAGTAAVTVVNPSTAGGTSNTKTFTIIPSIWYLAEGSTDWGFDCYITIQNPNTSAVTADITYMTGLGAVTAPSVNLPPKSQATIGPRDILGNKDFSTKVVCKEGKTIAVDRTMSWTGPGAASPETHSSIGVTSPAKIWYLPEGSSKWGFEAWLLIQNPNASAANCTVTYMIEGEGPKTVTKTVPASSRKSFNIADDIGQKDASIKVEGNIPVIPERAMYRNNRREGHDSIGTTSPAKEFYLAEGTSAYGFTTYVLVQNPNRDATDVTVTYMTPTGPKPQAPFSMSPNSRKTIRVNDALPNKDFSTKVSGTKPIIAERAMYWDNGTGEACHDSVGMASAHTSFYLPDGQTSEGRETYTLVQNPNSSPVTVEITYMTPTGAGNKTFTDTIAANSRMTYNMVDKGIGGRAAIMVTSKTSGKKIMCERAMYWNARGAGTDTIGGYSD